MKSKVLLTTTMEYGQGYLPVVDGTDDLYTRNYDYTMANEKDILDFRLHKIVCKLNSASQQIQSMTLIYKNRNTGELVTMLDTMTSSNKDETEMDITFGDFEVINQVRVWVKDDNLIGFEVKTNENNLKKFGYGNDDQLRKIDTFEGGNKVILGLGVHAGKQHGVSSIYFYYIDRVHLAAIEYSGLLQLRAKLKANPDFKKKTEDKKASLGEKDKFILDICGLPETAFFPITSYLMS
jgi:hypothetical protein